MSKSINAIIARICTAYGKEIKPELVVEYSSALSDLHAGSVELAVDELIREETWMPTAALIRKTAKKIEAASSDKPAEPEHWRRDRYNCLICRDTGFVTIWHPKTMQAAIRLRGGKITEEKFNRLRYEAVARCTCKLGESKPEKIVQYDESKDIRITCVSQQAKFDLVTAWAKSYSPPNYVNEFDQFNDYSQEDF